jgi:membrane fusion protein, multidrug efflux system
METRKNKKARTVRQHSGVVHLPQRLVTTFTLAGLLVLTLAGCGQKAPPNFQRPPAPVSVTSAVKQDVPVYIDEIGKAVAREFVSIQPQVSGRITQIHFTDGAELKTGDLLFTIDPRPYQAQLDSAKATLAEKKAALALAKIQFDRYAELLQTKSVSQQDYDQRKNTYDIAEAQVHQSEAALDTARLNLEYCTIRSPIDGRAGQRLVDIGNVVAANTGSLLTIQRLDPIYVDFTITENDLNRVQRNMAQRALKVVANLPDSPDKPREGDLSFVDNAVQESTGTVKLRATIPNGDHYFWPGRFVKVRLILRTLHDAVLVPAAAPQMSATGPYVYVIKDDSTAELRPVKLGQRQGEFIVIAQGVSPDDNVVINGQLGVIPGSKVHIEEPDARASSPSGEKKEKS